MRQGRSSKRTKLIDYYLGKINDPKERETILKVISTNYHIKRLSNNIRKICIILGLYRIEEPDELGEKIKQLIRKEEEKIRTKEASYTLTLEQEPLKDKGSYQSRGRRIFDTIGVAASIVLIISAIMLSTTHARRTARKVLCQSNIASIGRGILSYAIDFPNELPFAKTAESLWYDPEKKTPKRPHLFILVKFNYVRPESFICPQENRNSFPIEDLAKLDDFPQGMPVSYSFQNLFGDEKFSPKERARRWQEAENFIILADKAPFVNKGATLIVTTSGKVNSPNHSELNGQNILRLNGAVNWLTQPTFGPKRDNIWQAGDKYIYTGREIPSSATDIFLAP